MMRFSAALALVPNAKMQSPADEPDPLNEVETPGLLFPREQGPFSARAGLHFKGGSDAIGMELRSRNRRASANTAEISGRVLISVLNWAFSRVDLREFTYEKRRGRESNPRIEVLQTPTLPLGYPADFRNRSVGARFRCVNEPAPLIQRSTPNAFGVER